MRAICATVVFCVLITACDDLRGDGTRGAGSLVSSGEVALADGGSLDFGITSEQYKRWDRARKGIDKRTAARFGAILQPEAPTEASIERAVAFLDGQPSARRAIEAAGMSTRAFVVMTVALEQEMRRASGQPVIRRPESSPYEFPTVDTTMIAPMPAPAPYPVDTVVRGLPTVPPVDTWNRQPARDTARRLPPTIFRRDTSPVAPRPDSGTRRDSLPAPKPKADTVPKPAPAPAPAPPPDTLHAP